jgi:hypothetical protein
MAKNIILQYCNMNKYEFIPNVLRPAIIGEQEKDQYAQVVSFHFVILTNEGQVYDTYNEEYELERTDTMMDMPTIIGKFKTGWIDQLAYRASQIVIEQVGG